MGLISVLTMPLKKEIQQQLSIAEDKVEKMTQIIENFHNALLAISCRVVEDMENDDYVSGMKERYFKEYDLIIDSLNKKNDKLADDDIKDILNKDSFKCSDVYTEKDEDYECGFKHY